MDLHFCVTQTSSLKAQLLFSVVVYSTKMPIFHISTNKAVVPCMDASLPRTWYKLKLDHKTWFPKSSESYRQKKLDRAALHLYGVLQ